MVIRFSPAPSRSWVHVRRCPPIEVRNAGISVSNLCGRNERYLTLRRGELVDEAKEPLDIVLHQELVGPFRPAPTVPGYAGVSP